MQHLFTFLAPRNLNRTTLELFFSLNHGSGWASDRLVGVHERNNKQWINTNRSPALEQTET